GLRLTEDVPPWPGSGNMGFGLRLTEDVLPWPGSADMAFGLRQTEDVLPWPVQPYMEFGSVSKTYYHDNKDACVIQINNEIRNMNIDNLSITDAAYFQEIMGKVLANLSSKVVTYEINGLHTQFPEIARIILRRKKLLTFDTVHSMMLLEENELRQQSSATSPFHNSPSSPIIFKDAHIYKETRDHSNSHNGSQKGAISDSLAMV
nr:WRKY family transcription factor [Tanacetum cinerariifolium]